LRAHWAALITPTNASVNTNVCEIRPSTYPGDDPLPGHDRPPGLERGSMHVAISDSAIAVAAVAQISGDVFKVNAGIREISF
jgi:hypothetical protein